MKKYLLLPTIAFCSLLAKANATITITFVNPSVQYQLAGDAFDIKVKVQSTYSLTSAIASIGTIQTNLTYNSSSGNLEGNISLLSFPEGDTLNLNIDVADYLGNTQSAQRKIIYDNPPKLTLVAPLVESVARPTLPFKLLCVDKDSCTINISYTIAGYPIYSGKFKDSIQLTLNFSSHQGLYGQLYIHVQDKFNQTTQERNLQYVYVDTSLYLVEQFAANDRIIDFRYNKVFTSNYTTNELNNDPNKPTTRYKLIDVTSETATSLSFARPLIGAKIYDQGTIIAAKSDLYYGYALHDWYNGTIDSMGTFRNTSWHSAGNNLLWLDINGLILRNLNARSNTVVSTGALNIKNQVASSGVVAYSKALVGNNYNVYKYSAGVTIPVTSDGSSNKKNINPATDGKYIVYTKATVSPESNAVYFSDGLIETELSNTGTYSPNYEINNGFIAYTKLGLGGEKLIWLRDTFGVSTQISPFSATIEFLNDKGDISYSSADGNQQYIKPKGLPAIQVGSGLGTTYYYNDTWYKAIGRMLYRINISSGPLPVTIKTFEVSKEVDVNIVKWVTSKEVNTSYFSIEKSENGKDFSEMEKINSSYNANGSNYSYTDKIVKSIINYYRLKIVDKDGRLEYSSIKSVNNSKTGLGISIFPNPAKSVVNVRINSDHLLKDAVIEIVSSDGKVVYSNSMNVLLGFSEKTINISYLSKGIYFIRCKSSLAIGSVKFLKH